MDRCTVRNEIETFGVRLRKLPTRASDVAVASDQAVREQLSAYYPSGYGSITGAVADQDTKLVQGSSLSPVCSMGSAKG